MKKKPEELLELVRNALERAGASPAMARATARHLVRAEEHGLPTHGMSRVPFYCGFLRNGRAEGAARPRMISDHAAACLIDNRDALPYESAEWAIAEVIVRARRTGIAIAGITNSAHVGVLGIHLLPVAEAGMVGVGFTNSPAAIPPWGGKKALFGTDPVAFAGHGRYFERVEALVGAMLADEGVRLPGARRFATERRLRASGIEIAEELLARIERLAA